MSRDQWQPALCGNPNSYHVEKTRLSRCERRYRKHSSGDYELYCFAICAVCVASGLMIGLSTMMYGYVHHSQRMNAGGFLQQSRTLSGFSANGGNLDDRHSHNAYGRQFNPFGRQYDLQGMNRMQAYQPYRRRVSCTYDDEDVKFFNPQKKEANTSASRYIVINEARSGSSWLQEMSQMHPGIKVQFELDMMYGDEALQCMQCHRPLVPDTKYSMRIPPKVHPPLACGMTIFGSSNQPHEVSALAERQNASLIILLRINHVAQAVSAFLHFRKGSNYAYASGKRGLPADPITTPKYSTDEATIPWTAVDLTNNVDKMRNHFNNLLKFPAGTKQRAHLLFYEDLKARPAEAWGGLQTFLGLPPAAVGDLEALERKSTSKPSIYYLRNLKRLQAELTHVPWAPMLNDPRYDETIDFEEVFGQFCAASPAARLSWRGGTCEEYRARGGKGAGGMKSSGNSGGNATRS